MAVVSVNFEVEFMHGGCIVMEWHSFEVRSSCTMVIVMG